MRERWDHLHLTHCLYVPLFRLKGTYKHGILELLLTCLEPLTRSKHAKWKGSLYWLLAYLWSVMALESALFFFVFLFLFIFSKSAVAALVFLSPDIPFNRLNHPPIHSTQICVFLRKGFALRLECVVPKCLPMPFLA